jgi:hypothetical protein
MKGVRADGAVRVNPNHTPPHSSAATALTNSIRSAVLTSVDGSVVVGSGTPPLAPLPFFHRRSTAWPDRGVL